RYSQISCADAPPETAPGRESSSRPGGSRRIFPRARGSAAAARRGSLFEATSTAPSTAAGKTEDSVAARQRASGRRGQCQEKSRRRRGGARDAGVASVSRRDPRKRTVSRYGERPLPFAEAYSTSFGPILAPVPARAAPSAP